MVRTEDQHRFSVWGEDDNPENVVVHCERCGAETRCCGLAKLADLIDAADEHAEVCR